MTNTTPKSIPKSISEEIKIKIIKNNIEPSYECDIQRIIRGKVCCKLFGQIFESISKVFVAVGSILTFASGYYNSNYLAFIAGSVSTFSLALLQLSSFCYKEYKKQSDELNLILRKLDIDTVPTLDRTSDSPNEFKQINQENSVEEKLDQFINKIELLEKK